MRACLFALAVLGSQALAQPAPDFDRNWKVARAYLTKPVDAYADAGLNDAGRALAKKEVEQAHGLAVGRKVAWRVPLATVSASGDEAVVAFEAGSPAAKKSSVTLTQDTGKRHPSLSFRVPNKPWLGKMKAGQEVTVHGVVEAVLALDEPKAGLLVRVVLRSVDLAP